MPAHRETSEITPDGSPAELPEGSQHHDELANTDGRNHGADTSAPTRDDVPLSYGWTGASETTADAADADAEQGEALTVRADAEPPAPEPDGTAPYGPGDDVTKTSLATLGEEGVPLGTAGADNEPPPMSKATAPEPAPLDGERVDRITSTDDTPEPAPKRRRKST
jgi:hypothetical protein